MKSTKWSGRMVGCVLLASCIGIFAMVRGIHASLTRPPQIVVVCDSQLTPAASEKLTTWCKQHPEVVRDPQKLVDEFSWIKSCAVRYTKIGTAHISIVPHEATAVLNKNTLLVSNGCVVDALYYSDQPVAQFTVSERLFTDHAQRKALVASVTAMVPALFDQYVFTWHDATSCTITDKLNARVVVADTSTVSDAKKIEIGMGLAQGKCCADIRFDQQIILAKKRGGDEIISRS